MHEVRRSIRYVCSTFALCSLPTTPFASFCANRRDEGRMPRRCLPTVACTARVDRSFFGLAAVPETVEKAVELVTFSGTIPTIPKMLQEHKELPIPHFDHADPYPWQVGIYRQLCDGIVPESLYLPTGTGKTSIALLYLLALLDGAPLPRRLVYVVDRRAIVDQTRDRIREWVRGFVAQPKLVERANDLAAFPPSRDDEIIPVGVLRGGVADTGEWRVDPARPSVVVGTVDMIGSRLLFSGYGDGRSRRALHAGLLGHDTTIVLDEAHLSKPMDSLLRFIERMQGEHSASTNDVGRFKVLTMSATPSPGRDVARGWGPEDERHPAFRARLDATKRCRLHPVFRADGKPVTAAQRQDKIAEVARSIRTGSVVVYVKTVRDAVAVHRKLASAVDKDRARCGLLTGTIRGRERTNLTKSPLWQRFSPSRARRRRHPVCYLISTSAGEVGIDLDADHAVMDLVTIEGMVQRVGRVNREGARKRSDVHVIHDRQETDERLLATRKILERSKSLSPAKIADLAENDADWPPMAMAGAPATAPIDMPRVELLACTSSPERDAAVPLFLRGVPERDEPDVQMLWRRDLTRLIAAGREHVALAMDAFPPLPDELLTVPVRTAITDLKAIVARSPVVLRDRYSKVQVLPSDTQSWPDIDYGTLILPAEAGGLTTDGLLRGKSTSAVDDCGDDETRIRYEVGALGASSDLPDGWDSSSRVVLRVPLHVEVDDDALPESWLIYRKRRVNELTLNSDQDELTAIAARRQTLVEHSAMVAQAAARLALAVGLCPDMVAAIRTAGKWHDRGKAAPVWQRAAGADLDGEVMAKPNSGNFNARLLGGYRHEFGSLAEAEHAMRALSGSEDASARLILHLIAAHHGHARPGFADKRHWGHAQPDDVLEGIAQRAELRFAQLQRHYGPWHLAWLEAIVKAADAWVSSGEAMK